MGYSSISISVFNWITLKLKVFGSNTHYYIIVNDILFLLTKLYIQFKRPKLSSTEIHISIPFNNNSNISKFQTTRKYHRYALQSWYTTNCDSFFQKEKSYISKQIRLLIKMNTYKYSWKNFYRGEYFMKMGKLPIHRSWNRHYQPNPL